MRILYVISGLGFGGAEKQLVAVARALSARGHQIALYTLTDNVPRITELQHSGVLVVVDKKKVKLDARLLHRLRRMMTQWRPDLVHGFLFDGEIYARLAAAATGIPVLGSERSDNYRLSWPQRIVHRLTRGLVRGLVANTHSGATFARRRFALAADNVHVVWNGIDLDALECQATSAIDYRSEFFGDPGVRLACLVGSIRPAKDYALALDAALRLVSVQPVWRVLFIGDQTSRDGPGTSRYKASILERHRNSEGAEKIRFCGRRTDAAAIVRQCDVLYVSSAYEGFPNAVLEAMALGVPVASTEYSDIRRILPFGEQIAGRSADDLVRAMLWADAHRDAIVPQQRSWVRTQATIERAASGFESVYARYVGQRPSCRTRPVAMDHPRPGVRPLERER